MAQAKKTSNSDQGSRDAHYFENGVDAEGVAPKNKIFSTDLEGNLVEEKVKGSKVEKPAEEESEGED